LQRKKEKKEKSNGNVEEPSGEKSDEEEWRKKVE